MPFEHQSLLLSFKYLILVVYRVFKVKYSVYRILFQEQQIKALLRMKLNTNILFSYEKLIEEEFVISWS